MFILLLHDWQLMVDQQKTFDPVFMQFSGSKVHRIWNWSLERLQAC